MDSPFFQNQKKYFDIKELNISYHKKINDILQECFGVTRSYDKDKIHFGKFDLISYLNVTPMSIELGGQIYKLGGICSVATLPIFRDQGNAYALLETALDWMINKNFDIAVLFAANDKLYQKLGFVKGPEILNKVSTSPKEPLPLFIMAKHLCDPDFELFTEDNLEVWNSLEKF